MYGTGTIVQNVTGMMKIDQWSTGTGTYQYYYIESYILVQLYGTGTVQYSN